GPQSVSVQRGAGDGAALSSGPLRRRTRRRGAVASRRAGGVAAGVHEARQVEVRVATPARRAAIPSDVRGAPGAAGRKPADCRAAPRGHGRGRMRVRGVRP
ncbi:MAG: hypothetical protein AVDCRST_MAG40-2924, partial [uncultured Gemmatimonadaceae bacterium]